MECVFCNLIAICGEPEGVAVASPNNLALSHTVDCVHLPWAAHCLNRPHGVLCIFSCVLETPLTHTLIGRPVNACISCDMDTCGADLNLVMS